MNVQIVALLLQEGGKLISSLMQNRQSGPKTITYPDPTPKVSIMSSPAEPIRIETKTTAPAAVPELVVAPIQVNQPVVIKEDAAAIAEKAQSVKAGCIPCSLGHYGACSGMLTEALRFARSDGLNNDTTIDRVNMCLDELNTMERGDLRPEMIVSLPPWEKQLADRALTESRALRHELEGLQSVDHLEQIAARTQNTRNEIGRSWFKEKIAAMSPEDKAEMQRRVMERLEKGEIDG